MCEAKISALLGSPTGAGGFVRLGDTGRQSRRPRAELDVLAYPRPTAIGREVKAPGSGGVGRMAHSPRKGPTWFSFDHSRDRLPFPFPAFVAAFELGAHYGARRSVEPLPALILRAPVTHELEVGNQLPHPCGGSGNGHLDFNGRLVAHTHSGVPLVWGCVASIIIGAFVGRL